MTPDQIAELEALANFTNGEIVSMSPGPDGTPEHLEAFKEGWEGAMRLVRDALAPILAALKAQQPDEAMVERVARVIDPGSWAVMDGYLADMKRKYRGQNVAYDPDNFKHKGSMATARAAIAAMQESRDL